MLMAMAVRAATRIIWTMFMLMVFIMHVSVLMHLGKMQMLEFVSFAEVEPESDRHEDTCDSQGPGERFA